VHATQLVEWEVMMVHNIIDVIEIWHGELTYSMIPTKLLIFLGVCDVSVMVVMPCALQAVSRRFLRFDIKFRKNVLIQRIS
jgi:hypothetical protein